MRKIALCGSLIGTALLVIPVCSQQTSTVRHPGEHLHYKVTLADGDVGKITDLTIFLNLITNIHSDQPGAQIAMGNGCKKSSDPKVWTCEVTIPPFAADGDYKLNRVSCGTGQFNKIYDEEFNVPLVRVQNPTTFVPPSKVTVTEQP